MNNNCKYVHLFVDSQLIRHNHCLVSSTSSISSISSSSRSSTGSFSLSPISPLPMQSKRVHFNTQLQEIMFNGNDSSSSIHDSSVSEMVLEESDLRPLSRASLHYGDRYPSTDTCCVADSECCPMQYSEEEMCVLRSGCDDVAVRISSQPSL